MGFSISAALSIFFLAFIGILLMTYSRVSESAFLIKNSTNDYLDIKIKQLQSGIDIENIKTNGHNMRIVARNTGSEILDSNRMNLLIDGNLIEQFYAKPSVWFPETEIEITVNGYNYYLNNKIIEHRFKIITKAGISDYSIITL